MAIAVAHHNGLIHGQSSIAIFKIPELRQKILITLLFLAIYRVGFHIPCR